MDTHPAERVLALYRRIHGELMAGLPFLNEAIEVDVLGFQRRGGRWSGLLITPWLIDFLVLPREPGEWSDLAEGTRRRWQLPAGEVTFIVNAEPDLGHFQTLTLMAPVTTLADQADARTVATAALDALWAPAARAKETVPTDDGRRPRGGTSRRGFLRTLIADR